MIDAQSEKSANLLRISYSDHVGPDETKRGLESVQALLDGLKPGFRLLVDLSDLQAMDLACVPHLKRMMDACDKKGVDLVVRVVPDPRKDIGLNILSLFHYRRQARIIACATLAEALKALAS